MRLSVIWLCEFMFWSVFGLARLVCHPPQPIEIAVYGRSSSWLWETVEYRV